MTIQDRRAFLQFLGRMGAVAAITPAAMITGCDPVQKVADTTAVENPILKRLPFKSIEPTNIDELVLTKGLQYDIIARWDDPINQEEKFGFNNDYTAFIPLEEGQKEEGLLWVNHEYTNPKFVSGYMGKGQERTKEQVMKEQETVGGSIIHIKLIENKWTMVKNSEFNRRITARTRIPFRWKKGKEFLEGSAVGTLANCSGGVTPWGTILTCEENYDAFYGDYVHTADGDRIFKESIVGWEKFFKYPPENYGWVVEVNPLTGEAHKLPALGRCAHECATVSQTKDGRIVVYTGDDANDQCLYKFVAAKPKSRDLTYGTLYVANIFKGTWIPLDYKKQPKLQENFKSQEEVLVRLRDAAKLMGGTPLDRPEDIDIDPLTGNVFVSLTNNTPKGNHHGSILKIEEEDGDKGSQRFKATTFLAGGSNTGFSCPDNMAFDKNGNLWFTSDISGSKMNKGKYAEFKNNGLFLVPADGRDAGLVIQVASAPSDAELTGPSFSPDGRTLFLSVQHPGELSKDLNNLTSHWPEGGNRIPRSAVVAITGADLAKLTS